MHREENSPFIGMISKCFEPHLGVYIQSQDKSVFVCVGCLRNTLLLLCNWESWSYTMYGCVLGVEFSLAVLCHVREVDQGKKWFKSLHSTLAVTNTAHLQSSH